jgi:hypothetical protein
MHTMTLKIVGGLSISMLARMLEIPSGARALLLQGLDPGSATRLELADQRLEQPAMPCLTQRVMEMS